MKAILLSAGLGTRLRPITQTIPKPCVPVMDMELLHINLFNLFEAGIREVFINLHYLPKKVLASAAHRPKYLENMSLKFADETAQLLGTGGALANLQDQLLQDETFLVVNSDTFTDFPLKNLFRTQAPTLLMKSPEPGDEGRYEYMVWNGRTRELIAFPPGRPQKPDEKQGLFLGIQLLNNNIFNYLPRFGPSEVFVHGYPAMMSAGTRVGVEVATDSTWLDAGDPELLHASSLEMLRLAGSGESQHFRKMVHALLGLRPDKDGSFVSPSAKVSPKATIVPPVYVGADAIVGAGCVLGPSVVINRGSIIEAGARIEHSVILADESQTPAGSLSHSLARGSWMWPQGKA